MPLHLLTEIAPCLIALVGGILLGTLSRPLARYITTQMEMTEEKARGMILLSAKKVCLGFIIVFALVSFAKYAFSYGTIITTAYLTFLVFSILWGILMGLVKRFVTSRNAIRILQKL
jgi:hypothetical protein